LNNYNKKSLYISSNIREVNTTTEEKKERGVVIVIPPQSLVSLAFKCNDFLEDI
jgi:hypothetical protein